MARLEKLNGGSLGRFESVWRDLITHDPAYVRSLMQRPHVKTAKKPLNLMASIAKEEGRMPR
jgi:hypothetical protein